MTGQPASTPLCWWRVWFARVTISFFRISPHNAAGQADDDNEDDDEDDDEE